jgi:glycerol-3-phosphate cytidylyltransferase-like family protein
MSKKGRPPVYPESERLEIVRSLRCVDQVFLEESLEQKREYLLKYGADILVMGDDWRGRFDEFSDICQVHYLSRTNGVSTTQIIAEIRKYA